MTVPRIIAILLSLIMLGCGAAPGGDSLDGANGDIGLPLSGASQKITESWNLFKDGSYSSSKAMFEQSLSSGDAVSSEIADAYAGIGWCNVKLNGSASGISDFRNAINTKTSQAEARVGLAGALLSKGTKADIDEAVTVLEGIDPNNANFTFNDQFNTGVSNAEVHAMLAYGYFVQGNRTKSEQQMAIARDLDSEYSGTTVDQIDEVLSFIP
jgi:Tfp pilus assembly protein PilF